MEQRIKLEPGDKVEIETLAGVVTVTVESEPESPHVIIDFWEGQKISGDPHYVVIRRDPSAPPGGWGDADA